MDYEEFIKITRKHQAERERLKAKEPPPDQEYYVDISQISTLVLDNLVEAPQRGGDEHGQADREEHLMSLYGSKESYEKIRSMEMHLDDYFKSKCRQLKPHYWPVIPINPKPYLNPIR